MIYARQSLKDIFFGWFRLVHTKCTILEFLMYELVLPYDKFFFELKLSFHVVLTWWLVFNFEL